jgi:ribosomal protein S6--L-glutamate ligase
MRIGVLASQQSWYLADLRRAAGSRHEIEQLDFRELQSAVLPDGKIYVGMRQRDNRWDAVLVRSMPPASLEQVVFRMDALAQLELSGTLVLNPPRALEVAVDKYLTTSRLAAAGLLMPSTICCQTSAQALSAFAQLGGDVVLKPLFGGEGRGIARIQDEDILERAASLITQQGGVLYLQQFIQHEGYDIRVLLVGDEAFAIRRVNRGDWRTNISRGAVAERESLTPILLGLAKQAAAAVGAPVAGVDILPSKDGKLYVIEVNAVPGWRGLAAALNVDIAARVLAYVESKVRAHA